MQFKILIMFLPLVFLSGKAINQTPPVDTPKTDVLQELKDGTRDFKQATEELKAVKMAEPEVKVIYRVKKVTVIKEVPAEEHKYLVTIGGDQYEVEPTMYKGYAVINVDSIQKAIVEEEIEYAMLRGDTLKGAAMMEAKERISVWRKVINLFKRKKEK